LGTGNKARIRFASASFFSIRDSAASLEFCLKKKPAHVRWLYSYFDHQVELAGIEPASKQGSLRLSTCLSYDWIFDRFLSISTLITAYLLDLG